MSKSTEKLIREALENENNALRGALNKLAADRHKLIDEVDALKVERDDFKHGHIMQQAEIKAMREALEWYADESNYETHIVDEQWEPVCPIAKDEGQLARDTLLDLDGDTQ